MSYCVEITTFGDDGKYATNALRFATKEEAGTYGYDLAMRWLAVHDWRVTTTEDPVTAEIVDGAVRLLK